MCGRFVTAIEWTEIAELYDAQEATGRLPDASWNVAPTDTIGIVLDSAKTGTRRLEPARWGLVPGWADDASVGARAINARVEDVGSKPTFRKAVIRRRAIIPALGYYEWKRVGPCKQPYFVHGGGLPLAFAGLYEWWRNPQAAPHAPDRWVLSATILTMQAAEPMSLLHDRVPVLVSPELSDLWLDPAVAGSPALLGRVSSRSTEIARELELHPVSAEVGDVRRNGPHLIEEVELDLASLPGLEVEHPLQPDEWEAVS